MSCSSASLTNPQLYRFSFAIQKLSQYQHLAHQCASSTMCTWISIPKSMQHNSNWNSVIIKQPVHWIFDQKLKISPTILVLQSYSQGLLGTLHAQQYRTRSRDAVEESLFDYMAPLSCKCSQVQNFVISLQSSPQIQLLFGYHAQQRPYFLFIITRSFKEHSTRMP